MGSIYQFSRIIKGYTGFTSRVKLMKKPFYNVHGHFGDASECVYCGNKLNAYRGITNHIDVWMYIKVCFRCHWWRAMMRAYDQMDEFEYFSILTKKAVSSDDVPVEELREYLLKNWDNRKEISAKKCEEVVYSIFRNLYNCEIHYTTNSVYSKDGGIDLVFVENDTGISSAIQVKRRQTDKPESVKCIREFIGSIAQSEYNCGYFVTTADKFSRDASIEYNDSKENLKQRNIELSLIDGVHLKDMLLRTRMKTKGLTQFENFIKDSSCVYWFDIKDKKRKFLADEILEDMNKL